MILSEGVCQRTSKPSQIDNLRKAQKGMERKHKSPARNATQIWGRQDGVGQKRQGQRALGKQTGPLSPKGEQISTAILWEAPRADHTLKKASCVPKGLSVTGWLLLKIRSSRVW